MRKFGAAILFVLLVISCCRGCIPGRKSDWRPGFEESDLIGTWQAEYGAGKAIDNITLKADGTYQQVYRDWNGYLYESQWNEWYMEYRPTGWAYVHLEEGRHYVDGIDVAEGRQRPARFFYFGEDKWVDMIDELILVVVRADYAPRSIALGQERGDPDSSDHAFFLCRKREQEQETPTAQAEDLPYCRDFEPPADLYACRNLSVAEGYRLQIARLDDGTHWANLETASGSGIFIHDITRYAIEGGIMVGEIGPQPDPNFWFWFNLDTGDLNRHLSTKSEYLAALQELGFEEEPELHSIEFYCEKGDCRPCFGWSPNPTTTPTLSPSPTITATPAATP